MNEDDSFVLNVVSIALVRVQQIRDTNRCRSMLLVIGGIFLSLVAVRSRSFALFSASRKSFIPRYFIV